MENPKCPSCGMPSKCKEGSFKTKDGRTKMQRWRCVNDKCDRKTFSTPWESPVELLELIEEPISDNISDTGDHREITSSKLKTLDELLDYCEVDREVWEVKEFTVNQWPTTSFTEGEPTSYKNIQVKAKLVRINDTEDWQTFKKEFIETVREKSIEVPKIHHVKVNSDWLRTMLEFNFYDLHIGKLGWNPETRDDDYDHKVCIERFNYALEDLIVKTKHYNVDRILVPWGHDFFNSDIETGGVATTAAGTAQHNDVRDHKMWTIGRDISLVMVERLKQIAPVDIIIIPGNHDEKKMLYLGDLIGCVYHKDPNVNVDTAPTKVKYYRYGNTLLGLTHKIGGKNAPTEQRLLNLMPAERSSRYDFADTEFHEWHVGHLHHGAKKSQVDYKDHQGIVIRYMRSLSSNDAWHTDSGYLGAVKGAEALVFNYKTGPDGEAKHNIIFENVL